MCNDKTTGVDGDGDMLCAPVDMMLKPHVYTEVIVKQCEMCLVRLFVCPSMHTLAIPPTNNKTVIKLHTHTQFMVRLFARLSAHKKMGEKATMKPRVPTKTVQRPVGAVTAVVRTLVHPRIVW